MNDSRLSSARRAKPPDQFDFDDEPEAQFVLSGVPDPLRTSLRVMEPTPITGRGTGPSISGWSAWRCSRNG